MTSMITILVILMIGALAFIEWSERKNTPKAKKTYPVAIGYNGVAVSDEEIYKKFGEFSKYWNLWNFCEARVFPNQLVYYFKVYDPMYNSSTRLQLIRAKQIAERALTLHFHEYGYFNLYAERFVAVELHANLLAVHIALTDNGLLEIHEMQKNSCAIP
ncbi:MAG: hypothetical protein MR675_02265 [Lachnospira sp.]|nr:hypothetical protein [Lachnospira sp.]